MRAFHRDKETLEKKILTLLAENKMNVSEVARILCYHTNTIMYHIRQIHAATGKNPLNLFDLADLLGWVDAVRCKDCKYWHESTGYCEQHSFFVDADGMSCSPDDSPCWTTWDENDFCSDGKRKDGDG